ncbi:MAG: hypothetical protein M1549_03490 [Candidatus Dependentiae bacterium]|nr:hypothetical protein [Candidatus Dependentiae bacterium]
MKKLTTLLPALLLSLPLLSPSPLYADAVRTCTVSTPTGKRYRASFNCRLLRDVGTVIAEKKYRLDDQKSAEAAALVCKNTCAELLEKNWAGSKACKILKKTDWGEGAGSIIVKPCECDFVCKVFSQGSKCILGPISKSLASLGMWAVNRVNRFMLGFTRLSNRARLVKWLQTSKDAEPFRKKFVIPEKSLWIPKDAAWSSITWRGKRGKTHSLKVPDRYVIVCTAYEKSRGLENKEIELLYQLIDALPPDITVDQNKSNFFVTPNGQIAFVDTENTDYIFDRHLDATSYADWVTQAAVAGLEVFINTNFL